LQKLEKKFPDGALGAQDPDQKALERLMSRWMVESNMFGKLGQLLPVDLPLLKDPKFQKDREDFSGRSWSKPDMLRNRPEAEVHVRDAFAFMETTLLADGRDWVLKTDKPSLADIEGTCITSQPGHSHFRHVGRMVLKYSTSQPSGPLSG
jgi:glutathione S-transferase